MCEYQETFNFHLFADLNQQLSSNICCQSNISDIMKLSYILSLVATLSTSATAYSTFHQCIAFEKPGSEGPDPTALTVTALAEDVHVLVYALRDAPHSNLPFYITDDLPQLCTDRDVEHLQCSTEHIGKFILSGDIKEHVVNQKFGHDTSVTYAVPQRGFYCVYAISQGQGPVNEGIITIEETHSYGLTHLSIEDFNQVQVLKIVVLIEMATSVLGLLILKKYYKNDKITGLPIFSALWLTLFSCMHHNSSALMLQAKDTPSYTLPIGLIKCFFVIEEFLKLFIDYLLVSSAFQWSILVFKPPREFNERETNLHKGITFTYRLYALASLLFILFTYTNIAGDSFKFMVICVVIFAKLYVIIKIYKSFNDTLRDMIARNEDPIIISKFRQTSLMFKFLPIATFTISLASVFLMSYENIKFFSSKMGYGDSIVNSMEASIRTDFWYALLVHFPVVTFLLISLGLILIWRPVKIVDGEIELTEDELESV